MHFIQSPDSQTGIHELHLRLQSALQQKQSVLWLISGGSNIASSVEVMQALDSELTAGLTILLADERYGPVGHSDSNGAQLDAGGFVPKQAKFLPVLVAGLDLEATALHYEAVLTGALQANTTVIGQLGIGPDGHIAGILPHSAAVEAPSYVAAYLTPQFARLTLTFRALKHLQAVYCFAFGEQKEGTLLRLRDESVPFNDQPAQILKELPEAYIYNNVIGDSI